MDKYQQIMKLAEAAALIQEVMNVCDPEFRETLEDMPDRLADIADSIEGV
jgi:spore maturation protein SpmA